MKRVVSMLIFIGVLVGGMAGITAAAYGVGYLAEGWFPGASRLTNIIFLMLVFVMVIATLLTMAERKWSAFMQDRMGPNRARIALPGLKNASLGGLPHILTDSLKMLTKEDVIPAKANRFLFIIAPMVGFAPVFALFAVVPAGPTIDWAGRSIDMVVATPDFGMLYVLAIASLAVYGTSLAGWASNNKFALLGGVRAASQMISYEVALGLSLIGLFMAFSTVQLPALTAAQGEYLWSMNLGGFDLGLPAWGIILQPAGFLAFFAASLAETKRAPFDAPEGESEIVGYFVEYSGMKFGVFMLTEFIEIVVLAGVTVVLFLGGWQLPFGGEWLAAQNLHPLVYGTILGTVFWVKVLALIWLQLLIRWTFTRFRYDHIQTLGWKILLPMGLINVFATGALVLWDPSLRYLALFGLLQIGILTALTLSSGQQEEEPHEAGGHAHGHNAHAAEEHALPHGHSAATHSTHPADVHAGPAPAVATH